MDEKSKWLPFLAKTVSYILVAAVASAVTLMLFHGNVNKGSGKLAELESLLLTCFVGEADQKKIEDAGAYAMVDALGDQWSYYIPADQYADYLESANNSYVGIGVSVQVREDEIGVEVETVEPDGGAIKAGVQAGDIIIAVDGQSIAQKTMDEVRELLRGEVNEPVKLTLLRGEEKITVTVIRQEIQVPVATATMLPDGIGLIKINDFDKRCAQETKAAIEQLIDQGAKSLIFDVRFNPGGYRSELVPLLDYLLPEGDLFHQENYMGKKTTDRSDASCLEMPMAVLVNSSSYSAAEFFAAALQEYDWATVVGEQTGGKSYFQRVVQLSDGSAVGLSMGKYSTPNGTDLKEVGGLTPDIPVAVTQEELVGIYAGTLAPENDPQIQAAIACLKDAK